MSLQHRHALSLPNSFKIFLIATAFLSISSAVFAEVCVWRNPERTMTKIFPEAGDYKTITKAISTEERMAIEQMLRATLSDDEAKEWIYYEITDKRGEPLGFITADAEKGEYGVIEMVMGIKPDGKAKGVYIQRSREKDTAFKSKPFLDQFINKTVSDSLELGKDIKAFQESPPVKMVVFGVKKMLIFYDQLN